MVKQDVIEVLNILENKHHEYLDPAEHIYDAIKIIKGHLDDDDLIRYVDDFILGLSSEANEDFEGKLNKCIKILQSLVNN